MSTQTTVGKILYDVRDVLYNDVTSTILKFASTNDIDRDVAVKLAHEIKGGVHKAFERGTDQVLKHVK